MCMCVSSSYDSSTGRSYILGGFEDGSVLCWDERNTNAELNSCQLFSDPGIKIWISHLRLMQTLL